jgi:ATP-binding cassette subfamily B protein
MQDLSHKTLAQLLGLLWTHVDSRRRWQLFGLLVLIVISSLSEALTISAVVPFLGVLTSPDVVPGSQLIIQVCAVFGATSSSEISFLLTLIFVSSIVIASLMRFLTLLVNTRLSFAIGFDLSSEAYRRILFQPYAFHVEHNSSDLISSINKAGLVIQGIIIPALNLVSSIFLLISIVFTLILINPYVAIGTWLGFGIIYIFTSKLTNKKLRKLSDEVNTQSSKASKSLHEGLGGIRDIIIDGSQELYAKIHAASELPFRRASGTGILLSTGPHYAIEALGMVLIISAAQYLSSQTGGVMSAIPVLGALVLGTQRLLPVLQKIYGSWTDMKANRGYLQDALAILGRPRETQETRLLVDNKLSFKNKITLQDISFQYRANLPLVLDNINLTINKGDRVGFIGKTGSGKSTLLDIIMSLLSPTCGSLMVDGEKISSHNQHLWRRHIAHVPQAIYLSDSTVAENIAFGVPLSDIDFDKVMECAEQAQIADSIIKWSDGFKTVIGERGIRISGGQRQRIGIARALYKNADVLILDEATSALDSETESSVMNAIKKLHTNMTILIIAHRLTTLRECSKIVELKDGRIVRETSYNEIFK